MKRSIVWVFLSFLAVASSARAAETPTAAAIGEKDVADLASLWDGWFDNYEYTQWQEGRGIPAEAQEGRRLKIFKRVEFPELGKYITYVEQYLGDPPETLYRQRLYHHWWDSKTREIVTDIFAMTRDDEKRVRGAHLDPAKLQGLKTETMTKIPAGCEVRWRRVGDHFLGVQRAETCSYIPPGTGLDEPVRLSDTITLSAQFLTTTTQFRKQNGELWNGNPLGLHDEGKKARIFRCEVETPERLWRDLTIYDEGCWQRLETGGDSAPVYLVTLRRKKTPFASAEPDALLLTVMREARSGDETLIEARAAYDATAVRGERSEVTAGCVIGK